MLKMNGRFHKNKRRTNLSILSKTLKEIVKDENLEKEPPKIEQIIATVQVKKPKASKREMPIEGNGAIEKAMKKKPLQFINFKSLLTS